MKLTRKDSSHIDIKVGQAVKRTAHIEKQEAIEEAINLQKDYPDKKVTIFIYETIELDA